MILAPERMVRMEMLTLSDDAERLIGLMAGEGSVHIAEQALPPRAGEAPTEAAAPSHPCTRACGTVQNRHEAIAGLCSLTDELLRWLDLNPLDVNTPRREAFLAQRTDDVLAEADEALGTLRNVIAEHFQEREQAESALTRLDEMSEQMHLLNEHGLSFRDLSEFAHLHVACGAIERVHARRLIDRLACEACALAMRPVHGKTAAFLLIGDREQQERFDRILTDEGARILKPPERFVRSFEEGLEQVEIELWQERDRLAELAREFENSRVIWHAELSEWRVRLHVHGLLDEALSRLGSDGTITLISGFVPASRRASLMRRLEREGAGQYHARFESVGHVAEKETPTRLRNWRIFRPFELFVKTYGLPGYNDVDPTPFVALSFLAMFGMMFGDVGHGLVLAGIGAGMAFLPYRIFLAMRDLGRILMMAGLSGMSFGFLFGSVFGVEEDAVLPALWMRPSHPEHLTTFLAAALGLGIGVLSTGIILSIVQAWRQRNLRKALLGQWSAASLIFFWALLVLFGMRMMGKEIPAPPGLLTAVLAVPLCLIAGGQIVPLLLARRRRVGDKSGSADAASEEPEEEVATILFEPIEIVMNLFTNSVSFLRVAAFGLAHAALTIAVFTINDMVRVPGVSALSLPFEHLFIIVLEGMIVTIQCLRLEYYEFFSKFFVGNGVAYTPLTICADDSME